MSRKFYPLILFVGLTNACFAQYNDAQLWENIYLSKKISSTFTATFNEEGRIRNNVSQFNYIYGDFGLLAKLSKHFRASADYEPLFTESAKRDHVKHQYYVFLKYKLKPVKRFEAEVREMYQVQYSDINSSETGDVPEHYLRTKFIVKYNPYHYPWDKFQPYVALETYYLLDNNAPNAQGFNRNRYFLGSFYEINKKTYFELYYMIERNFDVIDTPSNYTNYVMGVGFEREL